MASPASRASVPEVTLAQLPDLVDNLAAQVRGANFAPDVIVYVERGARLPAWHLCRAFGCGSVAVTARRGGAGLKRALAPFARALPRALRDGVRRLEERWFWQRPGAHPRTITSDFTGTFARRRVLIVDDASDSGRTVAGCRAWAARHGAAAADIRVAVLGATTPAGRAACDFWVLEENCRLPWSSDSHERAAAEAAMAGQRPPPHA